MSEITRNPLCWPNNVGRTAPHNRTHPKFDERTVTAAIRFVLEEVNRLNKRRYDYFDESVIVSTNLRIRQDGGLVLNQVCPADTGVAVYFMLRFYRNGKWFSRNVVLTCDKWIRLADNLTAIAKDIEAQRARERWGCTTVEQAFQGYVAIPEKCGGKSWWDILGVKSDASKADIDAAYRSKSKLYHPDTGGSQDAWHPFAEAYDQAMAQFRS